MLLRSKLHHIGDRSWDACVPISPVLNCLRKGKQCPITVRATDDLNRNRFNPFTGNLEQGFRRNGRTFFIKMSYLIRKSFG